MIGACWNIRGLNKAGRLQCLADFVKSNNLDFVGVLETKKSEFLDSFLEVAGRGMSWKYVPAKGTAGGILMGLKSVCFPLISWQEFQYAGVALIKNSSDGFIWRLVVVYGSPYEETKVEFIDELHLIMGLWGGPTLLGGDFNLVRSQKEKSNGSINFNLVELFNNWIDRWGLIDLKDPSRLYTWTNNQVNPLWLL
jgi:hypothetical protein